MTSQWPCFCTFGMDTRMALWAVEFLLLSMNLPVPTADASVMPCFCLSDLSNTDFVVCKLLFFLHGLVLICFFNLLKKLFQILLSCMSGLCKVCSLPRLWNNDDLFVMCAQLEPSISRKTASQRTRCVWYSALDEIAFLVASVNLYLTV